MPADLRVPRVSVMATGDLGLGGPPWRYSTSVLAIAAAECFEMNPREAGSIDGSSRRGGRRGVCLTTSTSRPGSDTSGGLVTARASRLFHRDSAPRAPCKILHVRELCPCARTAYLIRQGYRCPSISATCPMARRVLVEQRGFATGGVSAADPCAGRPVPGGPRPLRDVPRPGCEHPRWRRAASVCRG